MRRSRYFHHVVLLAVATVLLLALPGCGDTTSNDTAQADDVAADTPVESLEGHATEDPDGPAEPETRDVELAPELESDGAWYNTEPLTLEELRGRPVLLVFWATY